MRTSKTVATLKRTLDVAVGLIGTTIYLVAYPVLALLIKLESPGPVIYRQTRVGRDSRTSLGRMGDSRRVTDVGGKPFIICKFRTMGRDAEKNGPQLFDKGGDPRVTRIGRILRSTHLDELPQFWSVLKGDMSFIGPRPERPHFTVKYFREIPLYRERTRGLKPGITGLSQIVLGYDDSLESVARKTHFDLAYRTSMSSLGSWLRMEAWVLCNTLRYLLQRAPLTEAKAGLAMAGLASGSLGEPRVAMVRHRGQMRPTLVLASSSESQDRARGGKNAVSALLRSQDARPGSQGNGEPVRNFFTVDVECWFHAHNLAIPRSQWDASQSRVAANVLRILDMLAVHRAKATFFLLGYVADRFPEVVRMIDIAGHEIGTHGYSHELVTAMGPYEFERDLDRSLNALARLSGQKVVGHRASNFSIVESSMWALDILARYGIEYDSSIFPAKRKRYGIPDYPNRMPHLVDLGGGRTIKEIPMSVAEIGGRTLPIAGGGYLRLYPLAMTDRFIRHRNRQGEPAMVYLHPWEIDTQQPRVAAGALESFQHYVGLNGAAGKLSRLLKAHAFGPVKEILESPAMAAMLARAPVALPAPVATPAPIPVAARGNSGVSRMPASSLPSAQGLLAT
ncbi:MAG: sugar transferase [Fibrobacteres bacterium]|nr:sugar transferase [Fibrobacterota bacterium]